MEQSSSSLQRRMERHRQDGFGLTGRSLVSEGSAVNRSSKRTSTGNTNSKKKKASASDELGDSRHSVTRTTRRKTNTAEKKKKKGAPRANRSSMSKRNKKKDDKRRTRSTESLSTHSKSAESMNGSWTASFVDQAQKSTQNAEWKEEETQTIKKAPPTKTAQEKVEDTRPKRKDRQATNAERKLEDGQTIKKDPPTKKPDTIKKTSSAKSAEWKVKDTPVTTQEQTTRNAEWKVEEAQAKQEKEEKFRREERIKMEEEELEREMEDLGLETAPPVPKAPVLDGWDIPSQPPTPMSHEFKPSTPFRQLSGITSATEALTHSTEGSVAQPPLQIELQQQQTQQQNQGKPCEEKPKGERKNAVVPDPGDSEGIAEFHGNMLEGFLARRGQDEKLAYATAAAFEAFLKNQKDMLKLLNKSGNKSNSAATAERSAGDDDKESKKIRAKEEEERMESVEALGWNSNFANWDEGSIKEFLPKGFEEPREAKEPSKSKKNFSTIKPRIISPKPNAERWDEDTLIALHGDGDTTIMSPPTASVPPPRHDLSQGLRQGPPQVPTILPQGTQREKKHKGDKPPRSPEKRKSKSKRRSKSLPHRGEHQQQQQFPRLPLSMESQQQHQVGMVPQHKQQMEVAPPQQQNQMGIVLQHQNQTGMVPQQQNQMGMASHHQQPMTMVPPQQQMVMTQSQQQQMMRMQSQQQQSIGLPQMGMMSQQMGILPRHQHMGVIPQQQMGLMSQQQQMGIISRQTQQMGMPSQQQQQMGGPSQQQHMSIQQKMGRGMGIPQLQMGMQQHHQHISTVRKKPFPQMSTISNGFSGAMMNPGPEQRAPSQSSGSFGSRGSRRPPSRQNSINSMSYQDVMDQSFGSRGSASRGSAGSASKSSRSPRIMPPGRSSFASTSTFGTNRTKSAAPSITPPSLTTPGSILDLGQAGAMNETPNAFQKFMWQNSPATNPKNDESNQREGDADDEETFIPDQSWEDGTFVDVPTTFTRTQSLEPQGNPLMAPSNTLNASYTYTRDSFRSNNSHDASIYSSASMLRRSRDLVAKTREMTSRRSVLSEGDHSVSAPRGPKPSRVKPSSSIPMVNQGIHVPNQQSYPHQHSQANQQLQVLDNTPRRKERGLQEQLDSLNPMQRGCVSTLRTTSKTQFPLSYYLRFAWCSPGGPFNVEAAQKVMKKFDLRYLGMSIENLAQPLGRRIVYPIPGLKTSNGQPVMYLNLSRFSPKTDSVPFLIDLTVYVMNALLEREQALVYGIAIIADFSEFTMANFSMPSFHKLLLVLQGRIVPTRVESFLIVHPPPWFGSIWTMMKTMMSTDFQTKVHRIALNDLNRFLWLGFETILTDDLWVGRRDAKEIVEMFIKERQEMEANRIDFY